jgi:hypothetical protein
MCKAGKRGRSSGSRGDERRGGARYVRSIRHKAKGIRHKAKGKRRGGVRHETIEEA